MASSYLSSSLHKSHDFAQLLFQWFCLLEMFLFLLPILSSKTLSWPHSPNMKHTNRGIWQFGNLQVFEGWILYVCKCEEWAWSLIAFRFRWLSLRLVKWRYTRCPSRKGLRRVHDLGREMVLEQLLQWLERPSKLLCSLLLHPTFGIICN